MFLTLLLSRSVKSELNVYSTDEVYGLRKVCFAKHMAAVSLISFQIKKFSINTKLKRERLAFRIV